MTVLSDLQIVDGLVSGHVVCRPLRPENVRGASIDLSLGEWFWRCDARPGGVFNPYDEAEVQRYFAGPFRAKPYVSVYAKIGWMEAGWPYPAGHWNNAGGSHAYGMPHPFKGIPEDWPVIVLRPRERLLCHSHEFAGIRPPGTSQMNARSTSGRLGLTVCKCAGRGDPGYVNRWTIELQNENDEAIVVPVGERMAQLSFYETGPTRESYGSEELYESKYQGSADVDDLVSSWRPQDMLPRSYRDVRQELLSLDADLYESTVGELAAESG